MAKKHKKDPAKVRAGRKGGRVSGGNWKNNPNLAREAGKKSAYARKGYTLEDFPLDYEDLDMKIPKGVKRSVRRRAKI